jgi:hypothetical protein
LQERDVGADELRFAVFGVAVGGGKAWVVLRDWDGVGGYLGGGRCWDGGGVAAEADYARSCGELGEVGKGSEPYSRWHLDLWV